MVQAMWVGLRGDVKRRFVVCVGLVVAAANLGAGANITYGGNTILSSWIGTAHGGNGILITTSGNTIGGTLAGAGNVVSGNAGNGIDISGAAARPVVSCSR